MCEINNPPTNSSLCRLWKLSGSCSVIRRPSIGCLNASNGAGKTALHLAAEAGEVSAVRQLLDAGADRDRRDAAGHCALESAHIAGHDNVAAAIIESIREFFVPISQGFKFISKVFNFLFTVSSAFQESHDTIIEVQLSYSNRNRSTQNWNTKKLIS